MCRDPLMPGEGRRDHDHLAVVQLVPAPIVRPLFQLGEADSRVHGPHRRHFTTGRKFHDAHTVPRNPFTAHGVCLSGGFRVRDALRRHPPRPPLAAPQPGLLKYLVQAIDVPLSASTIVEIGGADRLSYAALMQEYAQQRRLRRWMISVPVLTPRLSSLWLGLVTPLYARVGRQLVESMRHPTVVRSNAARKLFDVRPRSAADAIRSALVNEDRELAETRWSDSRSSSGPAGYGGARFGQRLIDRRQIHTRASPLAYFRVIEALGGRNGWLAGGVGMPRGRPMGRPLRAGDALDF